MKLYDIPRNSKIRVMTNRSLIEETMTFHHIDGMYSYITNDDGDAFHLGASTEMKLCDDGVYEIDE